MGGRGKETDAGGVQRDGEKKLLRKGVKEGRSEDVYISQGGRGGLSPAG